MQFLFRSRKKKRIEEAELSEADDVEEEQVPQEYEENDEAEENSVEEEEEEEEQNEDEEVEKAIATSSDEEDSDDENKDESYGGGNKKMLAKLPPRSSPRRSSTSKAVFSKDAAIASKRNAPAKRSKAAKSFVDGGHTTFRAAQAALAQMAKKVLTKNETPQNSWCAALLGCLKQAKGPSSSSRRRSANESIYADGLETIAHSIVADFDSNPNQAQLALVNLIFRSVGGSPVDVEEPEDFDPENFSSDEWEGLITQVIQAMERTPSDHVLLSADPFGAQSGSAPSKKASKARGPPVAVSEYRKLYCEFWQALGRASLSANYVGKSRRADSSDEESNDDEHDQNNLSSSRFQIELTRQILARAMELSGVGQPDIRCAAVLAAYNFSLAMLERTVELGDKVKVAERQLHAANRSHSKRKASALQDQISSWKRTVAELEDLVTSTIIPAVFMKRWRDTNKHIRVESIAIMSKFTRIRPDLFLKGIYCKYICFLLSDKEAIVRQQAFKALHDPFIQAADQRNGVAGGAGGKKIDLSVMPPILARFLPRITECVTDIDVQVQEHAMSFLLCLEREGFLDSLDDDKVWESINFRSLHPDTSPVVRRDALYFVMEQIEAFDLGNSHTESKVIERIDGLTKWYVTHFGICLSRLEQMRQLRPTFLFNQIQDCPYAERQRNDGRGNSC